MVSKLLAALLLVACSAPSEYVRPGETGQQVQRRADEQCIAWLADGVVSAAQGPAHLDHGRLVHEPSPLIQRTGAACVFGWTHNECVCRVEEFRNSGIETRPGFVGETVTFSACAELHRRHQL